MSQFLSDGITTLSTRVFQKFITVLQTFDYDFIGTRNEKRTYVVLIRNN